ncbi:MAG: putative transcriptional regulator [Circular genetic element sp.]|nr:MAG: putative transcriptional regulator [Circular genetic element sp.]
MSDFKRCSMSLPTDLVNDLDYISKRLRMSRSALLSAILAEGLPTLVQVVTVLPEDLSTVTDADARRFRGATADALTKQVADIIRLGGQHDLFSK